MKPDNPGFSSPQVNYFNVKMDRNHTEQEKNVLDIIQRILQIYSFLKGVVYRYIT